MNEEILQTSILAFYWYEWHYVRFNIENGIQHLWLPILIQSSRLSYKKWAWETFKVFAFIYLSIFFHVNDCISMYKHMLSHIFVWKLD